MKKFGRDTRTRLLLLLICDIISLKNQNLQVCFMAITVNIYYSGTNGNARKFAEEMISTGIVDEIRAEEGNLKYEYFFPMSDSETVLLIDIWKDQLALDIHHKSPMMSRIISLREKYNLTMKVERYITDEAGIPDRDKMFIKE